MTEEKKEAICLTTIPYLEKAQILKVFTKESGLISLIVKKKSLLSFSPFCLAEWVVKKGKGDLYLAIDATSLDSYLELRKSYATLQAAGKIAQSLLRSQMPQKPSPLLYKLLFSYFQKLKTSSNGKALAASFMLKLLIHEGLFSPVDSVEKWEEEEKELIFQLSFAQRFQDLERIILREELIEKIDQFFEESISV